MKHTRKYPSNRIKDIREDRGLTQEQLAEKLCTSNQQIGRLENSERRLTWEWMQRIANALECHPMDLVDESSTSSNTEERKLLNTYRALPPQERKTVADMADYLAEKSSPLFKASDLPLKK